MTSNFLSTLDFTVNLRHPDTGSTATGGTDNGGNPGDTQPIPEGSPTPNRSPLESTISKKLFTNAGENEAENSELKRVLVSTDGVFYENQADDIRSNLEDLRTVWSQETISITPKKHSNGFAELMKQVREFKADSHKNDEGERNNITEEDDANDLRNRKHEISLMEIMEKLAEFRSEIKILRDTMESERNCNQVLRHDIEAHKQELLRQIEAQKTIIERQQETILQKELESCSKERTQSDDNIREADVRETIEIAREAQITQYREEVNNLQKLFHERIQEMSSEHKTYDQTVQQLNTKLLEYENEITRLRNEMETERKHIRGPPSPCKDGQEDSQESVTRTNHESDSRKSNQILNERTERFVTSDSTPALLDSSNKGDENNRQRNKLYTNEVHRREVDDDYILESGEDVSNRELFVPESDMSGNISERPTTAFREKPFTPGSIPHKEYSHQHEFSDQEISQNDEDADEDCHARDSPRDYGYENYGHQDLQETQKKFPSERELEEILNGGDEPGKLYKIPGKNFNGDRHHSLDNMVSQHRMHDQDMRHVWSDITNTHAAVDQASIIRSYDACMHKVHDQNNLTLFPRMYGPLDVIQEESVPSSPDNIDPDVSNVTYRQDKQQQTCDPHLKKDGGTLPCEIVDRSFTEQNAKHFPSHVCNENLKDLNMKGLAYRVHQSASNKPSLKKPARDMAEAHNTHADKDMYHVYPDDLTIIAIKKEIDELRKDFEQTKPNDQMSLKEVTDAEIENLKKEIQTLKKVFEKDEEKSKTYPETEDDKLIECLRNEVQQLRKNLEKIENSKPPVQPNYEDVIDTIRKEIETIKMEQEKNKSEINTSTAEDMAVVIELLKKEIQSIKNDTEKGQDRGPTALIYEDVIRRLQDDIEKLQGEQEKPLRNLNTSTNADDDLAMGSVMEETEMFMTSQKERQDLEKTAFLLEADLETLKSDFDTMKKEQKQICDRDKVEMYEMEINALRKEIDTIKTTPKNVELESLQQGIGTEMDSLRKEFIALREQQDKIRYQTETSLVQPCPSNVNSFDTMRQEIETIKDALEKLKTKLTPMGFDPSQTNEEVKVTKTNELEAKQQEKEMYQLKEITARNTDYDQVTDSLRSDVDQLKEDKKKRRDTEMASTIEAKINALIKDMEHMKQEQEKIFIVNEEQEKQRQLDGTYRGAIRKEMDGLKRGQEKLKQHLEGRQDCSLTPNEDIIDTLRKEVDALKMEKQHLEGRKNNSLTSDEDIIDTLRKDVDALQMEKQLQSNEDRRMLEALRSEVDSLRKLQEQVQYQETDSSTLTPGPSDVEEPVLDTIKEGRNKEYILRDAFDQLCYECKQRDEEIEACKTDIKKLFELLQISLTRMDNERQTHVETINEKLAKYSESINKVLTVTKMQSEDIEKLLDDTENEKKELRAEVDKYRKLLEGITSELQQEVESLKKRYEQVFTRQQEIENLRISTEETDASTRNKLQEMSNLDNDILLRLENLNASQEDQTEKIASLTESLEQYRSEIPTLHKAMETEREKILDLQRGLQMHRQELREDLNYQLTALETHRKEVETKTDAIQAELQELHKVNVQQHKLKKTRRVTELQDPVMKDKISSENIPGKTTVKDLGSLAADNELFEGGLQRRAKVKELEVTPTINELIEETNDTEERSTLSSWYSAVSTRQKRKEKSNSCLGFLGRICCTALPLILLLLLFLIFALFVPFFHECCTRTNTYRHSPMFYRYVDGPPPI